MYKIGEFSKLAKTTVKTLRYYEKEKLFVPSFIDTNGYRYYSADQLLILARIVNLRQTGFSIEDIKSILLGQDFKSMLMGRKAEIEKELTEYKYQLSKINFMLEEQGMKYETVLKDLPECIVYYKEGRIKDYSEAPEFIISSAEECRTTNPDIKCVEPDYSFINYLDKEYRDHDTGLRYCQAVTSEGIPNETIKFMRLRSVKAVCVYHRGPYENLGEAYGFVLKFAEDNGYKIAQLPRERYIDGIWNKENSEDWLTEIQVPVE